jgi:hypothetical protein
MLTLVGWGLRKRLRSHAPDRAYIAKLPALILHLAAIKAHVRIVSEAGRESIGEERRIAPKCGEAGSTRSRLVVRN